MANTYNVFLKGTSPVFFSTHTSIILLGVRVRVHSLRCLSNASLTGGALRCTIESPKSDIIKVD